MKSTFSGFEVARSALNASQTSLDVVSQNISNANTKGYTRQQVNASAIAPQVSTVYTDSVAIYVGQGVQIDSISQIRDKYLDSAYRKDNAENSALNTTLDGLDEISSVLDEYAVDGLNSAVEDFYTNLQTMSSNTSSTEFASLLRTSAKKITQVLNTDVNQLNDIAERATEELEATVTDINSLLSKIKDINQTIKTEIASGDTANELLDKRNLYIDELSSYVNVSVETQADNTVAIKSGSKYLIDDTQQLNTLSVDTSSDAISIKNSDGTAFEPTAGSTYGYLQLLNGKGSYAETGENDFQGIPYYLNSLNAFAQKFAETYNNLNSVNGVDKPLFTSSTADALDASNIGLSSGWLADASYISSTSTTSTTEGANENLLLMIQAGSKDIAFSDSYSGNFQEFVTSLNFNIATDVEYYKDSVETSDIILENSVNARESMSSVSLDEESINMIKYQKAYTAAARVMTTLDEALDILINKTGVVGR